MDDIIMEAIVGLEEEDEQCFSSGFRSRIFDECDQSPERKRLKKAKTVCRVRNERKTGRKINKRIYRSPAPPYLAGIPKNIPEREDFAACLEKRRKMKDAPATVNAPCSFMTSSVDEILKEINRNFCDDNNLSNFYPPTYEDVVAHCYALKVLPPTRDAYEKSLQ